jgi:nucleotide-binding universal stress UspA family protein
MKTILIPVDLIGETDNALKYAAAFAADIRVERIVLLKSYYVSVYEQILPTPDFVQTNNEEVESHRQTVENQLKAVRDHLQKGCNKTVDVETAFSSLPLLRAVHNYIIDHQPNVIILGTDRTTHQPDSYLGEQLISITKTSPIPVFVIPANAEYQKIEEAVVPCDFSAISRLSALQGFHTRQRWVHPHLKILNIDAKHQYAADDKQISDNLAEMVGNYGYEVYHSTDKDIVHGVLSFARHHEAQIIIALPGKYSFFYNLTHKSITHAIALNATRPVLILKN